MKTFIAFLLLAALVIPSRAQTPPPVGSISENRGFALSNGSGFNNTNINDYEGKILIIMLMTPWCPTCQSNTKAVGDNILSFFDDPSRGNLRGKNDRGVPIHSILLSTEEAEQWDSVNTSFSATNGFKQWGLDANAQRGNPRTMLGYFRGGFIEDTDLHAWGNDRRRLLVFNGVRNSPSHAFREIVINQNAYTSSDNTAARAAINAIRPTAPVTAPAITTNPSAVTISYGATTTLTAAASGTSPSFQWYVGNSGVTSNPVAGATSASFKTPALTSNTRYWVRATNSAGSDDSSAALVTVNPARPVITTHPGAVTINSGGTTTLTVAATGNSVAYQWYVGNSGVTTTPVSGASSASFTTPALTSSTRYWVRATNSGGSDDSTAALVTVNPPPATTTFTQWQATYSFPPGQSGPKDDPDGDGISNVLESFHGTHPLQATSGSQTLRFIRDGAGIKLIYQRAKNLGGYTSSHQLSTDLRNWTVIPSGDLSVTTRDLGITEEVTVALPAHPATSVYYQIKVTSS